MAARLGARLLNPDQHKLDVAWNNCFSKIFNASWYYACFITPTPEKNDFYNKTT